jgi:uncharacterized membrane-anchored protein YhcB (DUF1043 family)
MEQTLKNVVNDLLEKIELLKQEKEELVSRCRDNCRACKRMDCRYRRVQQHMTIIKSPLHLVTKRS